VSDKVTPCLLFNLAIEPLANLLRKSDLNGYQIPGSDKDLTLFADDTTVVLAESDSYDTLLAILTLHLEHALTLTKPRYFR
jgi:hypothetical protein